uniref:Uncharacterized protein n=1 Tax=Arion vulgaris TaxID=1028688 RepID=A0A0B7ADY5_9EUPU
MVKMVRSDVVAITGFIFCLLFAHSEGAACMECTNYINGVENNNCPISGPVPYIATAFVSCTGFCFQRTFASDPKLIARGCTTSLTGLPEIIPPPNCYDWEGALFCVCSTPLCNIKALGTSTGMSLDYLVAGSKPVSTSASVSGGQSPTAPVAGGQSPAAPVTAATTALTSTATPITTRSSATSTKAPIPTPRVVNYPIQCIDCRNYFNSTYYSWCPGNGSAVISQVYSGDCQGPCFTRSDINDKLLVVRGCTASQMTFPKPLPADGCYTWNDATVCVCSTSNCNLGPIGVSSNVQLDAHLIDVQPAPGAAGDPLQCYECMNYNVDGTYVPQCPKDGRVNSQTVFYGNCTGACSQKLLRMILERLVEVVHRVSMVYHILFHHPAATHIATRPGVFVAHQVVTEAQ